MEEHAIRGNDDSVSRFPSKFHSKIPLRASTSGRFVSRASLRVSSASCHPRVSILKCSRRAWRSEQSERSCNGKGAFINDLKRRTGREERPRSLAVREKHPSRRASRSRHGECTGATVDQRLIKFWRDRSSCALPAVDSRIVFTPALIRCPIMPFFHCTKWTRVLE